MPDDNNNPARGSSGAATFLREIEERSPFEAGGRLPRDIRGQLLGLDPESLGRAITILLRHAAGLPPIDRSVAAETIEALLAAGAAGSTRVEIDVPGLVELYRDLGGDRSRRAISDLVARLLRDADPEAAARLDGDDGRTMAEPPDPGAGPTRGMDFPPTSAEPTAGAEPTPGPNRRRRRRTTGPSPASDVPRLRAARVRRDRARRPPVRAEGRPVANVAARRGRAAPRSAATRRQALRPGHPALRRRLRPRAGRELAAQPSRLDRQPVPVGHRPSHRPRPAPAAGDSKHHRDVHDRRARRSAPPPARSS